MKIKREYKNFIFDLYGTLVDIRTNEWSAYLWKKMQEFYAFHGAVYTPVELKKGYFRVAKAMDEEMAKHTDYPEIQIEPDGVQSSAVTVFRRSRLSRVEYSPLPSLYLCLHAVFAVL